MARFTIHPELTPDLNRVFRQQHRDLFDKADPISTHDEQATRQFILDGESYIIKRYHEKGLRKFLQTLLGLTRAMNSFKSSQKLAAFGIQNPRHLFLASHLELRSRVSFLIMEKCKGRQLYGMIFDDPDKELPKEILRNVARLVSKLHRAGYAHGDLHSRNILVNDDHSVELIDLDGITPRKRGRAKDRLRLLNTLNKRPDSREFLEELLEKEDC